ncbi:MAG: hypothetical protein JJT78_05630 [Leptospira sp.]|nr:hypothetical protein [Leptospira sp.]
MRLIPIYSLSIILLVVSLFHFEIAAENKDSNPKNQDEILIQWREVPYASGYIIQVRNDQKQNLIDQKTSKNSLGVKLKPGNYEQRIGVINKFGRLERFSEWNKLNIVLVKPPEISPKESPLLPNLEVVPIAGVNTDLKVQGKNFVPDTKFTLRNETREIQPSEVEIQDDGTAKLTFPEDYLPEGNWDLVVENPRNKKKIIPKFAQVHKPVTSPKDREFKEKELAQVRKEILEKGSMDASSPSSEKQAKDSKKDQLSKASKAGKDRWDPVWRSALLPGWGHFYMEKDKKGWIHSSIFTLGFLFLYQSRENLISAEKNYNTTLNQSILLQATNPGNLGVRGFTILQDENKFQEYNTANQNYNLSLFLLLGFYFYQLYDSYSDSEEWYYGKQSGIFIDGGNRVIGENDLPQIESFWKAWFTAPLEF